jgi:ATP-binding protein involved in chromosome partitioning
MLDNNKIIEVLRTVMDPSTGQDIIQSRRLSEFKIQENKVFFTLDVTSLDSRLKGELNYACVSALEKVFPEAEVHIHMKSQTQGSPTENKVLPHIKNIIAVASGKGGVGKSTISVNLALALQKTGAKVGILDADLYGPSIPLMLGLTGEKPKLVQVYGQNKIEPIEKYGLQVMSIGFIVEPEQAVILRGPRLAGVLKQFIQDCIWPGLDYLIVDLPPGTGDIQLTLVQTVPVTGAIIVTTPQEVAIADALKAMNMFRVSNIDVPILGVVENMSWFTPEEYPDHKYFIFGQGGAKKLAETGKVKVLGQVPLVQSLRESGDAGKPIVLEENNILSSTFDELAQNTIVELEKRMKEKAPTQIVQTTQ